MIVEIIDGNEDLPVDTDVLDPVEELVGLLIVGLKVDVGVDVTCCASTWARSPSLDLNTRSQILHRSGFFIFFLRERFGLNTNQE